MVSVVTTLGIRDASLQGSGNVLLSKDLQGELSHCLLVSSYQISFDRNKIKHISIILSYKHTKFSEKTETHVVYLIRSLLRDYNANGVPLPSLVE